MNTKIFVREIVFVSSKGKNGYRGTGIAVCDSRCKFKPLYWRRKAKCEAFYGMPSDEMAVSNASGRYCGEEGKMREEEEWL